MRFILAGDLGATKTLLSIFQVKDHSHSNLTPQCLKEFTSREYSSFVKLTSEFLSSNSIDVSSITQATFGVAGPVVEGRSKLTNLPWELDERVLSEGLSIRKVKFLNDLEAAAFYVPFLKAEEKKVLYQGDSPSTEDRGVAAVIAPGTGLGEAFLTWDGGRYAAHASEGGHSDFASTTETQDGLLQYLRKKFGHASYELVCSGIGIFNTWKYFHESENLTHPSIELQISKADDPTPIIVHEMMKEGNTCQACNRSLDTFVSVLGAESGNLALRFLARNGVYIDGGLPKLMLPALTNARFIEAYLNKGRMSKLVSQFPVIVVLTHRSVLLGAAHYALDSVEFEQHSEIELKESVVKVQEA
jgi:glucokinase